MKKRWKEDIPEIILKVKDIIEYTDPFISSDLENNIKEYIEKNDLGIGKVMNALRLAIVGASIGPHLFDIMELIGKEQVVQRIESAVKNIKLNNY